MRRVADREDEGRMLLELAHGDAESGVCILEATVLGVAKARRIRPTVADLERWLATGSG
jgi:hypothetical protein